MYASRLHCQDYKDCQMRSSTQRQYAVKGQCTRLKGVDVGGTIRLKRQVGTVVHGRAQTLVALDAPITVQP
jgi:phosphoribosylformimino-5-aminoimidazole carboxamide ribonucleotide (ProFAR) isomerase